MNRKKRREAGAIAIEAILSLSIFIMAILAIMMGAMLVRAQSAMQYALDQTAKEVSGYFYLLDKIGVASMISGEETDTATAGLAKLNGSIEDIINFSGSVKDEAQELSATAENAISGNLTEEDIARIQGLGDDYTALQGELNNIRDDLRALRNGDKKLMFKSILQVFSRTLINKSFSYLVTPLVCEALVPKYLTCGDLDAFYRESGIHDIRFEGSEILADGRSINLVCTYKVDASRLTLGFYRKDLQFVQVASTAAWVRPNSSGSLVSLEKICANYDAEYAAAHSISVEEEPATTAASEASTDTTDSSTDTDTSDSTTGTDTTDESESSTTATTLSPDEQALQTLISTYSLTPAQAAKLRSAYELFDGDLFSAIGSCSSQRAAVMFVANHGNEAAQVLIAAGEDGILAYNQLDAYSQPILLANTNPSMNDDAFIRALVAWVRSQGMTNLTQTQIDQFAAQYRNGGGADPEAEVPERTTPTTETTAIHPRCGEIPLKDNHDGSYISNAGLRYSPLTAGERSDAGNAGQIDRIDHIMEHAGSNAPEASKFDVPLNNKGEVFNIIDEAYQKTTGRREFVQKWRGYNKAILVDMGRPVGVNGETYVLIIIKNPDEVGGMTNEVKTAFPISAANVQKDYFDQWDKAEARPDYDIGPWDNV